MYEIILTTFTLVMTIGNLSTTELNVQRIGKYKTAVTCQTIANQLSSETKLTPIMVNNGTAQLVPYTDGYIKRTARCVRVTEPK